MSKFGWCKPQTSEDLTSTSQCLNKSLSSAASNLNASCICCKAYTRINTNLKAQLLKIGPKSLHKVRSPGLGENSFERIKARSRNDSYENFVKVRKNYEHSLNHKRDIILL